MTPRIRPLLLAFGLMLMTGTTQAADPAPPKMNLMLLKDHLAVARLEPKAPVPAWATAKPGFLSITRTGQELSIVCLETQVPPSVKQERGWRILRVQGPLDFGLVGILASITAPLAKAGISIFAVSSYDTDYVMVKQDKVDSALAALRAAGHTVEKE